MCWAQPDQRAQLCNPLFTLHAWAWHPMWSNLTNRLNSAGPIFFVIRRLLGGVVHTVNVFGRPRYRVGSFAYMCGSIHLAAVAAHTH